MKNLLYYTQQDINLMLWQYAIGILDLANAQAQTPSIKQDIPLLDTLVDSRSKQLKKVYDLAPSFKITFEKIGESFRVTKASV
jgi:hypothetical protein